MITLLLQLILAHIIGDFVLQPQSWVQDKQTKKHKSKYLYAHMFIHLIALVIVLKFDFKYWAGILAIITSHYIIDVVKLYLIKRVNGRWLFFLDQIAHIAIMLLVVNAYTPIGIDIKELNTNLLLLLAVCTLSVSFVASVIMKTLISKWNLDEDIKGESLTDAGAYIGILERLFVFAFIVMNYWEGIGFLIAAKSVFRFGDLSKAKDRKLTEYILIGTLLSFGLAIGVGMLFKYGSFML